MLSLHICRSKLNYLFNTHQLKTYDIIVHFNRIAYQKVFFHFRTRNFLKGGWKILESPLGFIQVESLYQI